MIAMRWIGAALLVGLVVAAGPGMRAKGEPPEKKSKQAVTLGVAKDRARLLHDVYAATLEVIHHRYFRHERTMVPARALEDVFVEMNQSMGIEARWIAVNLKPMSLNHEPATPFEKLAAKEIAAGKTEVDSVEEGFYRRAGVIPIGTGCVGCHEGFFKPPSKGPKFAALVIGIPVVQPK